MMRATFLICLICFWLPSVKPAIGQSKLRASAFKAIIQASEASHSDALLIYQDGKVLVNQQYRNKDEPIYIASAGKSLTSVGIGRLLELGKLKSIDEPLTTFFPEWKQGRKKDITVRMLLNHTSGLQNNPNASVELEPAPTYKVPDVVQLGLCAELEAVPGKAFAYNNKAVALLAGVIQRASGKRMDIFFEEELFRPMGITKYNWIKDDAGNPTAHGAFIIRPSDFLKFGELMLNEGVYQGRRLVSPQWVRESIQPGQAFDARFGLLWWILYDKIERTIDADIINEWRMAGIPEAFLRRLNPIVGKVFSDLPSYSEALKSVLGEQWQEVLGQQLKATGNSQLRSNKKVPGKLIGYYANGYRGNYVVVIPAAKLVAVRCKGIKNYESATDGYDSFPEDVAKAALNAK